MKRICILFFSLALSAPVHSAPSCAIALEELASNHPEFLRAATRDPTLPLIDAEYPSRLHDSLNHVFAPWLTLDREGPREPFVEMLRRQHQILVKGLDGTHVYRGASRIKENIASGYIVAPSVLRHEFSSGGGFGLGYRTDLYLSRDQTAEWQRLVDRYRKNRVPPNAPEPTEKTVSQMPGYSSSFELIELPRVGRTVRTWNNIYEHYVYHQYYDSKDVPIVLDAMGDIMQEIRGLYQSRNPSDAKQTTRLLHLLAEYVYLGSHSHMFTGANYSLVMGQANFLLRKWNLRGISQTDLDYVAMARPFTAFESRFLFDVSQANPLLSPEVKAPAVTSSDAKDGSLANLTMLAHIANVGDRPFWGNEHVGEKNALEGILIPEPPLPDGVGLFYRAILAGTGETSWQPAGTFLGTRGQSRAILGLAFRLAGPGSESFKLNYQIYGHRTGEASAVNEGDYPFNPDPTNPIIGFRLSVQPNSPLLERR